MISVVATVHNEGSEVQRTLASVLSHTGGPLEIVIVDDGSTDTCCAGMETDQVRVIRNDRRIGVAHSRDLAVQLANGDVLAFLDGHQRVSKGCLNRCAEIARRKSAIVCPDIRGFNKQSWTAHGAMFRLCSKRGYFSAKWRLSSPHAGPTRVTALRCPGYLMSPEVYGKVRWVQGLRNWGGSEAAISLKAFFLDIPILHQCGVMCRHMFKKKLNYDASWDDVWRNHALIARVCFDDRTWYDYWLPEVFDRHLTDEARQDLESQSVRDQHDEFLRMKVRTDREFWTDLLFRDVPAALR